MESRQEITQDDDDHDSMNISEYSLSQDFITEKSSSARYSTDEQKARLIDMDEALNHLLEYDDHVANGTTNQNMKNPVPLEWIVYILQDIWEAQGLCD